MIENLAVVDISSRAGAVRRPYIKPFVRNLDAAGTEGGKLFAPLETLGGTPPTNIISMGPGPS